MRGVNIHHLDNGDGRSLKGSTLPHRLSLRHTRPRGLYASSLSPVGFIAKYQPNSVARVIIMYSRYFRKLRLFLVADIVANPSKPSGIYLNTLEIYTTSTALVSCNSRSVPERRALEFLGY
jgi:hypothetical protein